MGAIHCRQMVTTVSSLTGWGAVFKGRPACGALAHKLPGAESCLLALIHFLPFLKGCRDCQDGQHGSSVSCKSPGGFTVVHTKQACAPPPLFGIPEVIFRKS